MQENKILKNEPIETDPELTQVTEKDKDVESYLPVQIRTKGWFSLSLYLVSLYNIDNGLVFIMCV